jgi:hypothetical protein
MQVNLTDKKCGTCRWWEGERKITFWGQKPFKVECETRGNCPSVRSTKTALYSCPRWVAWEKLP